MKSLVKLSMVSAFVCAMAPATAQAESRDLEVSAPMVPFIYRYSACLFDNEALPVDDRITECRTVRQTVESEADMVFAEWLRRDRPRSDRMFDRALDVLEYEARYAQENREPVPPSVVAYLDCVGTRLSNDPNFRNGTSLDFPFVDEDCRDAVTNGSVGGRENTLLSRLDFDYRAHRSASGRMPTITYRYGLLAPRRF